MTCSDAVRVAVPATSANLGVGYDCLGMALDLTASFAFRPSDELLIDGCEMRFRGADNLVWTSMLETFSTLGVVPVTSHITIDSPIPLSGGLGSSATCVVAGVIAAIELAGRSYDRDLALDVATGIEGHPDNVAPAILGGLVNSFVKDGRCVSTAFSVDPTLRLVAVAPPYEVRTDDARRVIPAEVPVPTAVWQMGRAVASVHAFVTGDMALLSAACDDRLHEPYRKPLIPDYDALRQASVAAGASAFFISGSGSTCIAACASEQVAASVEEAIHEVRPTFWTHVCAADPQGAHLV